MTSAVSGSGALRRRGYTLVGPDEAAVVVLLHGVFFDRSMWAPVVERLAVRYRVLTVDLPGHGELGDRSFSLGDAAASVKAVLVRLNLQPAALVGLSLGGYVAMALVDAEPTMAPKLVLSGATREPRGFLRGPLRRGYRLLAYVPASVTDPIARMAVRVACPRSVAAILETSTLSVSGGFRAIASLPADGFLEMVRRWAGSILIVNGRRDPVGVPAQKVFLGAMRRGSLLVIDGVGHLAPLQAPDAFTSAVITFLDDG